KRHGRAFAEAAEHVQIEALHQASSIASEACESDAALKSAFRDRTLKVLELRAISDQHTAKMWALTGKTGNTLDKQRQILDRIQSTDSAHDEMLGAKAELGTKRRAGVGLKRHRRRHAVVK